MKGKEKIEQSVNGAGERRRTGYVYVAGDIEGQDILLL